MSETNKQDEGDLPSSDQLRTKLSIREDAIIQKIAQLEKEEEELSSETKKALVSGKIRHQKKKLGHIRRKQARLAMKTSHGKGAGSLEEEVGAEAVCLTPYILE